jgi:hypothetical protein
LGLYARNVNGVFVVANVSGFSPVPNVLGTLAPAFPFPGTFASEPAASGIFKGVSLAVVEGGVVFPDEPPTVVRDVKTNGVGVARNTL